HAAWGEQRVGDGHDDGVADRRAAPPGADPGPTPSARARRRSGVVGPGGLAARWVDVALGDTSAAAHGGPGHGDERIGPVRLERVATASLAGGVEDLGLE